MTFRNVEILAQAEEMIANLWDWHPTASLPENLMLAAYPDGIWVTTGEAIMSEAVKIERICDSWM